MRSAKNIILILAVLSLLCTPAFAAKEDQETPKEFGLYAKTTKGLHRITPNIIFDQDGVLYIESNEPQRFPLNAIQHFVIYGKQDITYLTLNPLLFFQQSPLGRTRFVLGKDIPIETKKIGELMYSIKPKSLFGRGYYCFWLEDLVWDFIVE
jgi:hypothetical protein